MEGKREKQKIERWGIMLVADGFIVMVVGIARDGKTLLLPASLRQQQLREIDEDAKRLREERLAQYGACAPMVLMVRTYPQDGDVPLLHTLDQAEEADYQKHLRDCSAQGHLSIILDVNANQRSKPTP
jgi:hypothetical protein